MNAFLSPSAPAYSRLQHALAQKINAGEWKSGEQIPPERRLAEEYSLSVGTVRKALEQLVLAGYCYRVQGKGTFVADYPADRAVFYRTRTSFRDSEGIVIPFSIQRTCAEADEETAEALGIRQGSPCICITRCLNGRSEEGIFPLGWSASYFLRPLCNALLQTSIDDFKKHSLYFLAERDCGISTLFCEELMHARFGMPEEVQAALGIQSAAPCFELGMISYTYGKKPFEFRKSYVYGKSRGLLRRHDFRQ